jgi:5-methylcytosine-specific restriction endonuclease McrA
MPATLQRPTLILNRNWQPIRVSTVARSLILVWNDHARIVDPADFQTYDWSDWTAMAPEEGELFIQAVTYRLRVPEVVALTKYDRVPLGKVAFNRRNLFKRDHETCQYCGDQPGLDSLTIDHILPRSRGGTSTWENCVLACIECNKRKADRTPKEAHMKLGTKPGRPKWQPLYATRHAPVASWTKFISEAYWNVELEP